MPVINISTSVAANATNSNVLSGNPFEFLPFDAFVEYGLVASATGLTLTVSSGSDLLSLSYAPSIQNRFPIYPDDYVLNDVGLAGDRLVVQAVNTTAGALTLFTSIRITPQ